MRSVNAASSWGLKLSTPYAFLNEYNLNQFGDTFGDKFASVTLKDHDS